MHAFRDIKISNSIDNGGQAREIYPVPDFHTLTKKSPDILPFIFSFILHITVFSGIITIAGNYGSEEQNLPAIEQIINIEMAIPEEEPTPEKEIIEEPKEIIEEPKEVLPVIKEKPKKPKTKPVKKQDLLKTKIKHPITANNKDKKSQKIIVQKAISKRGVIAIESYIQRLARHINTYKYYPKTAQRRQIEGLVIVSFSINTNGQVYNEYFVEKSGYNILDQAALKALKRAEPLPLSQNKYNYPKTNFRIPIRYSIKK